MQPSIAHSLCLLPSCFRSLGAASAGCLLSPPFAYFIVRERWTFPGISFFARNAPQCQCFATSRRNMRAGKSGPTLLMYCTFGAATVAPVVDGATVSTFGDNPPTCNAKWRLSRPIILGPPALSHVCRMTRRGLRPACVLRYSARPSARLRFALLGADFGPACVLRYSARTSAPPAFCVTRRGLRPACVCR